MSYVLPQIVGVACSENKRFVAGGSKRHGHAVIHQLDVTLPPKCFDDSRPATNRLSSIYKGIATLREKPHTHSLDRAREMIERVKAVKLRMT